MRLSVDDYSVGNGMGVDVRYAESDQYAYRDLRTIAGIVARVKSVYYPNNAIPRKRFLGFSSGAGLGLTMLKYRHDLFDVYASRDTRCRFDGCRRRKMRRSGQPNPFYDAVHFDIDHGFHQYPRTSVDPKERLPPEPSTSQTSATGTTRSTVEGVTGTSSRIRTRRESTRKCSSSRDRQTW